jgi:hypothetical protein
MKPPLEFHPLANIFPLMTDEEVNDLGEDMLDHGQREPIALFEGMILDGRNRYRACMLKGIEPRFVEQRPADPVAFVVSVNLKRRHLDDTQRAMVAAKLATLKRGDNQHSPNGGTSQTKAAELLNVNKRRVERSRELIERGVPDLVDAVDRREVKVTAAVEFAKENPPIDQARLIAEAGSPAAAVKTTSTLKRSPSDIAKADRAEQTAAGKAAASKPKSVVEQTAAAAVKPRENPATAGAGLVDLIEHFGRINVSATVARMSNDDRIAMMTQIVRANSCLNKTAIEVAVSGGANVGKLAPVSLRLEVLEFLRAATARIEAELADRAVRESAS